MDDLNGVAVRRREGRGPTVIFLPGYASDMAGSKAVALDAWAVRTGRAFVRFDYRGCGESAGAFEDFTLEDWRDDALAVIDSVAGSVVLVGSSMGGWIMLLAALSRPERMTALVGIAAAPDFTEWGFDAVQKAVLAADGRIAEVSVYGPPMVTTRDFWEAGQRNLLLGSDIALGYLKNGAARMGERMRVVNLLNKTDVEVEIVSPHFIDPEGSRLRA